MTNKRGLRSKSRSALGGVGGWGVAGAELDVGEGFEVDGDGAVEGDHVGESEFQLVDAFAGDSGDQIKGQFAALGHRGELLELVGIGDVGFSGDEDGGLGGEGGVEGLELFGDDFEVVDRVVAAGAVGRHRRGGR